MSDTLLLAGTRKGLFIGRADADRSSWAWDDPLFAMQEIYSVAIDTRGPQPRLLVGATSPHWGPQVFRSDDLGRTWNETPGGAVRFPEDTGAALERVWQLRPAPEDHEGVVYAGTEPSALFRSTDRGETFEIVRTLWDHPHRPHWHPGGGGQAIHTVLPHPTNPDVVTIAMSTGGVYRTEDAGETWTPYNRGIGAEFIPGETPEYGQCVHKVAIDAGDPDRMYAQNHGGVFRTDDAGRSWHSIADGLPAEAHTAVLRDAFVSDQAEPLGLYLGTRHGAVWASNDEGGTWVEIRSNLPDVLCVRAAVL